MKKNFKIFAGLILLLSIAAISCKNSFLSKPSVQGGSISIVLPGSGRAADNDQIFNFEICFRYVTTKAETILKGKTGEKIIYENAQPGEYEIIAQVFDTSGKLCYEAEAKAVVTAGNTTPVTLELMRFLRLWTINDDYATYIKKYMKEHPSDDIVLEITQYDNAEQYQAELDAALKNNAPDAPDIFSVEDPVLLRYTQGDMQDYTLPFESLGITQSQIDDANFYEYILQMATGTDNKIHGLGYQSTAGAMIYNKAIAEDIVLHIANAEGNSTEEKLYHFIFADDNPYQNLMSLFSLNVYLADEGKSLVSSYDDLWKMFRALGDETEDGNGNPYTRYCPWLDEDNNLILNPIPYSFFNDYVSPKTYEPFPCHNTSPWTEDWYADMTNDQVFAYFAPTWFINYCLKDTAKVDTSQWGIIQSPVPFTWGGSFLMVNKNIPEVKKGVAKRIIEWMTLDTTTSGLMYKVATEENDTVTSQYVMTRIINEGKGTCATLGGADIFTIYDAAAQAVNPDYKTPYDSTLDNMFNQEIRDYVNFGLPRGTTLLKFQTNVYRMFGFRGDDIVDDPIDLKIEDGTLYNSHLSEFIAEPCNEGIKCTMTFTSQGGSIQFDDNFFGSFNTYFIRKSQDGIAMFLNELLESYEDVLMEKEPGDSLTVTCIYPVNIEKDNYYCFDLNYHALDEYSGEDQSIPFVVKAGGGKQYINYDGYENAKPELKNFEQDDFEIKFDIIPSSKLSNYCTFDNDVDKTNIMPDYELIVMYLDENNDLTEASILTTEYNEAPKLYSEGYSNGIQVSINAMAFEQTFYNAESNPNPLYVRQFLNIFLQNEKFQRLRFRIPPVTSDEYKISKSEYGSYTIKDPTGAELISFIPQI